jgi:hypothetical protein
MSDSRRASIFASTPAHLVVSRPCLHCSEASTVRRRRGLCRECYGNAAIRAKYPQVRGGKISESGRGSTADRDDGNFSKPVTPTSAQPGSEERIQVLMKRAADRQPVYVRGDATL